MNRIYRIRFVNQGKIYELYAEAVYQSEMYGFVVIEDLLFDRNQSLVLDPSEERLKDEFQGVSRTMVPMHAVIRVDEVTKKGTSKILDFDGSNNVAPFPGGFYSPKKPKGT